MSEGEKNIKNPSEELAEIIVKELSKDGVLHEDDAKQIGAAISSGEAKAEDWRIVVEKAIDREKESE